MTIITVLIFLITVFTTNASTNVRRLRGTPTQQGVPGSGVKFLVDAPRTQTEKELYTLRRLAPSSLVCGDEGSDGTLLVGFGDIIEDNAFENCLSIEKLEFTKDADLTSIGAFAFRGSTLEYVKHIPSSVLDIKSSAFRETPYLQKFSFEKGSLLQVINDFAFYQSGLKSIDIPCSVIAIAANAFRESLDLKDVAFEKDGVLSSIGEFAFFLTNIDTVNIPSSVTSIGASAFRTLTLKHVNIEEDSLLTSIGSFAFFETQIKKIYIPSLLTSLGDSALRSVNLKEVTIASNCDTTILGLTQGVNVFFGTDLQGLILQHPSTVLNVKAETTYTSCLSDPKPKPKPKPKGKM